MSVELFFNNKILSHFSFPPTPCQERLFSSLSRFVTGGESQDILVINGYAGTGKTTSIAAFVKTLKEFEYHFKLIAPTGRAAKVLSGYTGERALTIHKQIYRQKSLQNGVGQFVLNINKSNDTIFIVDEASLINTSSMERVFGSGDLLGDLMEYIREGNNNKLILIGDDAQLPPVSFDKSPALDLEYLSQFGEILSVRLSSVVRQVKSSGILSNATILRNAIEKGEGKFPKLKLNEFEDVVKITGGELIETIGDSYEKYGEEETVILCRSNKRANRYNAGVRGTVLFREEKLTRGDRLMVVKNCYQFLENVEDLEFIANGDVAELLKIGNYEERYGLHFAQATLVFPDYNNVEITAKIILDTLTSETASLSSEQQNVLYQGVYADYEHIKGKRKRNNAVREDLYYNALQVKYAFAITCHKSQGGQWKSVFIDNPFWQDEISVDDLKWFYTAMTRAVEKIYLINPNKQFYE